MFLCSSPCNNTYTRFSTSVFRVLGITEWITYLGVTTYKLMTTFVPFFSLAVILCLALKSVLMGNGGRWLGTILIMIGKFVARIKLMTYSLPSHRQPFICLDTAYAFSSTPIGLILAKKFIQSSYKETANWFPGVYYTFVALPYIAWSSALQAAPSARDIILIIGDVLCIIPFFAFQRGLGGVIIVSTEFKDQELKWSDVWAFETRIWYTILTMFIIGTIEWRYLYRITTRRAAKTNLSEEEMRQYATPVDITQSPDIEAEYQRSQVDNEGINSRELVKVFVTEKKKKKGWKKEKQRLIKSAAKGVSFGIRNNEIYTLLGPNGAGK